MRVSEAMTRDVCVCSLVRYVTNSTQGFTWTLAGLKGRLDHDVRLNFVADRFPKGSGNPIPIIGDRRV
jgi:hypothetical protein